MPSAKRIAATGAPSVPVVSAVNGAMLKVLRQQQRLVDFRQVVVFAGHPEDGHALHARALQAVCQCQSRRGFQKCQQRAAEQSDLLTGDDGDALHRAASEYCAESHQTLPKPGSAASSASATAACWAQVALQELTLASEAMWAASG